MRTFRLPDLGEGLNEAELVAWHVAPGSTVVADQPLLSVETAKAVVEVPAPWSGRIRQLHGAPGDVVQVGQPLADFDMPDNGRPYDNGTVVGTLPDPAVRDLTASADHEPARAMQPVRASPAVRRRAAELGVDIAGLDGSGPGGTVTLQDIGAAAKLRPLPVGYHPLRGMRRAMAEAMARAVPHVATASVADEARIDRWPPDADPTLQLIKAIAVACRAAPHLNAWYDAERNAVRYHDTVDLGLAMETEHGLSVPVLTDVAARSDGTLRAELDALKRDATQRNLSRSQLKGQTITLSSFGMYGGLTANMIVLPPQVAILGAGRIHRAVRVVDDEIRLARVIPLSLSFDHRVVTGLEALRFLNAVIEDLSA